MTTIAQPIIGSRGPLVTTLEIPVLAVVLHASEQRTKEKNIRGDGGVTHIGFCTSKYSISNSREQSEAITS